MKAVILAAGIGSRLAPLTNDRPKALVEVLGRSLLFRQLDLLAGAGIPASETVIVGGYQLDMLRRELVRGGFGACTVVDNDRFQPWNNFYSLAVAQPAVDGHDFLQLDGDVLLDERILPRMIAAPGEALLAVDCRDELDDETMKVELRPDGSVVSISKQLPASRCVGEYIGVTKLSAAAARQVFAELAKFPAENLTHEYYEHAYHRLTTRRQVGFGVVDVADCTVTEIDDVADLERAADLLRRRAATRPTG